MIDDTPAILTAGEAARLVGKSVPTITRAIKSGKLTATPRKPKGWNIDRSELFRVFDAVTPVTNDDVSMLGGDTPNKDSVLQVKLDAEVKLRERVEAENTDLKEQRDKWQKQAEASTHLLTDQRQQPEPRKGFWARLGAVFTG